jgi:hypothetical protein
LPGGYDFALDAYFAGIGAVGSALGRIETIAPPDPAPISLRFFAGGRPHAQCARRAGPIANWATTPAPSPLQW